MTATLRIPAREGLDALVAELREQIVPGRDWACSATGVAGVLQAHVPSPGLLTAAERRGTAGRAAGEVAEDLYRLDAPAATLLPAGRRTCEAGTVRCEPPPGDIHRLGNPAADTAITLHVYGTDVDRLGSSARRTYELPVAPSDAHTPDELAGGRT